MPAVNLFGNPILVNNRGPYQGFIDQGIRFEDIVQIQPMTVPTGNIIYWDYEDPRLAPKCALERVAGPDFL